jgi:hypothetical protein
MFMQNIKKHNASPFFKLNTLDLARERIKKKILQKSFQMLLILMLRS